MQWIIFSLVWTLGNSAYIYYAAQGTFGQVSPTIPLLMGILSFVMLLTAFMLLPRLWNKPCLRFGIISTTLLWAGVLFYNLWSFLQILYVS